MNDKSNMNSVEGFLADDTFLGDGDEESCGYRRDKEYCDYREGVLPLSTRSTAVIDETQLADESDEDFVVTKDKQTDHEKDKNPPTTSPLPPFLTENNQPHRTYLVTYSNADMNKFPTRQYFARAVVGAFGGNNVDYYVCGRELHQSGEPHYHLAIRLHQSMRWRSVKQKLNEEYGIVVNFSEPPGGGFYSRAYAYVTKQDEQAKKGGILLEHPPLETLKAQSTSVAAKANATYREKRKSAAAASATVSEGKGKKEKKEKEKRLEKYDVVMLIRKHMLKTDDELLAFGEKRAEAGETDLSRYLVKLGVRGRNELIVDAWKMAAALQNVSTAKKSRVEILHEYADDETQCVCHGGVWLALAMDLLRKNQISLNDFCSKMFRAILVGRKKHVNIMITGPSNCGKTFLLEPLNVIYRNRVLNTPASSMFGWKGVEDAHIIYLNDFRWVNPETNPKVGVIMWDAFLRLLEGNHCSLPAPMNHCAEHINLTADNDVAIFATSIDEIVFYQQNVHEPQTIRHQEENKMMRERWIDPVFKLSHIFDKDKKVLCEPCGHCFATLVLKGKPKHD